MNIGLFEVSAENVDWLYTVSLLHMEILRQAQNDRGGARNTAASRGVRARCEIDKVLKYNDVQG